MHFRNGDNTRMYELDAPAYKRKSSERLKRVLGFCKSEDFEKYIIIIIAFVGPDPSWHLTRIIDGDPNEAMGLKHDINRFRVDTPIVVSGECKLADQIIRTCEHVDRVPYIRLQPWRDLGRPSVFLNERLARYSSPIWKSIPREISAEKT